MKSKPSYISISSAAKTLDCETDKIHELADQGLIRRKFEGDSALVRRDDIEEVYRLQLVGELRPGELVRRLLFLEQKVSRLENAINLLFEVNNLSGSRFEPMQDFELHGVYKEVVDAIGRTNWTTEQLTSLSEDFIKITEVEVDRLNYLLQIDNAWFPFYQLCLKLTKHIGLDSELDSNLDKQRIRDLLYQGRKNLQTIAILFIERKAQLGPSRELLAKLAAADIDGFDSLAKQLVKEKESGGNLSLVS